MAGEPALDKVLTALKTLLTTALTGSLIEIDRSDDNPFGEDEVPAVNIICRPTRRSAFTHSETLHIADIELDMIVAVEAASTNAARLRDMEATIIAALWADRTLGGLISDYEIDSGGDEDVLSDVGARPLSFAPKFLTPVGDDRTIIGPSGLVP